MRKTPSELTRNPEPAARRKLPEVLGDLQCGPGCVRQRQIERMKMSNNLGTELSSCPICFLSFLLATG